ncbi:MAG: hypothetical protein QOD76_2133 [Solirubrobacteraceae bacterium]|jgi:hypothetical protein|nr:hypothetical protein [Solirubrobacteraceae bacterium]
MDNYDTAIEQPPLSRSPIGALADLDSLVAEVGATYPSLAFTAESEEDREDRDESAIDGQILAGLVSP